MLLSSVFQKRLENWYNSLNILQNSPVKPSRPVFWFCLFFLFQNSIRFNFFARYQPIYTVYFLLCEFWQIVSFKELVQFIQVFKSVDIDSFIVSLYLLTSKGSLVMFPISFLVLVMFILSFLFLVWLKNYTVYPSFQRNSFALTDFLY